MLDFLRTRKNSLFVKFILGFVVLLLVVFFGVGSGNQGTGASEFANVNGESIPQKKYNYNLENARERFRIRSGSNTIHPFLAKRLEYSTGENLINSALMQQQAQYLGVGITDKELATEIKKSVQNQGQYDHDFYKTKFLDFYSRSTGLNFETDFRKELTAKKISDHIEKTESLISENDIKRLFAVQNRKPRFQVIKLPKFIKKPVETIPEEENQDTTAKKQDLSKAKEFIEEKDPNAKSLAEEIFAKWQKTGEIQRFAEDKGLKVRNTGYLMPYLLDIALSGDADLNDKLALIALNKDKPFPDKIIEKEKFYYIVKFDGVQPLDPAKQEKDLAELKASLRNTQISNLSQAWADHLKKDAEIEVSPKL